jgi:hypothetical protein
MVNYYFGSSLAHALRVIFSEISSAIFQNWTFLKCPKINFSNFIFRHFFQGFQKRLKYS